MGVKMSEKDERRRGTGKHCNRKKKKWKKRKWEDIERKWISKEALIKEQKLTQKQGENKIKSKVQ